MLARAVPEIPLGEFGYEPKWDGFRAIISRTREGAEITSRGAKSLTRYFPELVSECERQLPVGMILDGEVVVTITRSDGTGCLDFAALQQRIHPASSRVELLARTTPASFIGFDLLAVNGASLVTHPFRERRVRLELLFQGLEPPLHLTAITDDPQVAFDWFERFEGAGLDGVIAKAWDLTYQPDVRAMLKVKHHRSADCVVAGYRRHKNDQAAVGALLLGLYDRQGRLQYVGSTSSFAMVLRREIAQVLQPLVVGDGHPWLGEDDEEQRRPGALSRWTGDRDRTFVALDPVLVCEVRYDQLEGNRFRHTTTFVRWRLDRSADECTFEQLEIPADYDLASVLR